MECKRLSVDGVGDGGWLTESVVEEGYDSLTKETRYSGEESADADVWGVS